MGMVVSDISAELEARDPAQKPDSWVYVVHNVVSEEVELNLQTIQAQSNLPDTGNVFISALSRSSVTISGPRARRKELFNSSLFFRDVRSIALPIFGDLWHASHFHDRSHVQAVVQGGKLQCQLEKGKRLVPVIPLFSTSTGKPFLAESA
jgi:monodictyphenone polyketide synthase